VQAKSLIESGNEALVKQIGLRQIAWCYALGQSLRGLNPTENLSPFLSETDLTELNNHQNKPLALLNQHAQDIKRLKQNDQIALFAQLQMDSTLVRLLESQGKSERIKSTVFPVTYSLFLHGIIYLFVITLSISLSGIEGYYEIPLLLLIAGAFFLLEKSATHMQDPFENRPTDTATTTIARTIEINIKQLLNEPTIPQPLQSDTFYQL
jgi:ion channel-forming bestrophin family protein